MHIHRPRFSRVDKKNARAAPLRRYEVASSRSDGFSGRRGEKGTHRTSIRQPILGECPVSKRQTYQQQRRRRCDGGLDCDLRVRRFFAILFTSLHLVCRSVCGRTRWCVLVGLEAASIAVSPDVWCMYVHIPRGMVHDDRYRKQDEM